MTAYEIISIFIGMLALLTSFGSFIVALLAFFDKKNKRKQKYLSCPAQKIDAVRKDNKFV